MVIVIIKMNSCHRPVLSDVPGHNDPADDGEVNRELALEAQPASGLPSPDPCCRSPGDPRPERLVGAEGLACGATPGQSDGPSGGIGPPYHQKQAGPRETKAEGTDAVTGVFCSVNAMN